MIKELLGALHFTAQQETLTSVNIGITTEREAQLSSDIVSRGLGVWLYNT